MLYVVGQPAIMEKLILNDINEIISSYNNKSVQIIDGLYYNQYQTIKQIEFYWNSQYISGQFDEIGRIKPFYNISKFRVNVATRATDLDVKDVRITSDNRNDRVRSMLLNHELKNWFKEVGFSKLLNDWGKTRAKYGGALIKKYKDEDGELKIELVEWKNVITDQTDIENGVVIEVHYMSPSELSKKNGVWNNVPEAMKLATKSRGMKGNKDQATEKRIPIYEVHGEFPANYNPETPDADPNKYERMTFIIAGSDTSKQIILWHEMEDENPYSYLGWDSVTGRGLGIGIVEDGFQAQMWTNEAITAEKNVMDLAGKVFIKTNASSLQNNIIADMENGQVIKLEANEDANILNLTPSSLPQFQNLVEKWNTQYERSTNTFDSVSGETLPSNTPLGSVAIQSAQASSFFDYRREEAGIYWSNVLMEWVLPYLIKKINKDHILASDFSIEELKIIDKSFSIYEANNRVKEAVLSGKIIGEGQYDEAVQAFTDFIAQDGKRRYLDVPKGYFKDYEDNVTIDITGETRNKQAMLQSLDNILAKIQANPAILTDPNASQLLSEMLELSGINFMPQPVPQVVPEAPKSSPRSAKPSAVEQNTQAVLPQAQQ